MDHQVDNKWLRLVYLVLFYLIYSITDIVLLLITLVQAVLSIVGSEPSQTLQSFGASLGSYLKQIAYYLSYHSHEKPYPFADWPASEKTPDDATSID